MTTFAELAALVSALEAPDRHLDGLVWDRIGLMPYDEARCVDWMNTGRIDRAMFLTSFSPRFTNRVNDAMDLLPPPGLDWLIDIQRKATKIPLWICAAFRPSDRRHGASGMSRLQACAITACGLMLREQGLS